MFLNGNFFNTSSFSKDMIRNIAKNIAGTAPNKTYDCFEIIAAKFNCLYSFITPFVFVELSEFLCLIKLM